MENGKSKYFYGAAVVLVLIFSVSVLQSIEGRGSDAPEVVISGGEVVAEKKFPDVLIEAKAAYVYDMRDRKVLYEKNPELQLPLASVTKLMSAYVASQVLPATTTVRITQDHIREEGDSGLRTGEEWLLKSLMDYSLLVSSNDGMKAIASVTGAYLARGATATPQSHFVEAMNRAAREIGLSQTYYLNQSGLDLSGALSGGYGSAHDMALLMAHILRTDPHLLEATTYDKVSLSSDAYRHDGENTNKIIMQIPNVIASKTGFTDLSGGNLVIAFDAGIGHPIVVSVLGSSTDGRFNDVQTLVQAASEYLSAE